MTNQELETFVEGWAREAARHSLSGDQLQLQQNENYFRRVMVAHVGDPMQRESLALLRRALFQRAVEEAA